MTPAPLLDPYTILAVDDSPETLSMLNDTLSDAGYQVLVALNGKQALSIIQNVTPDIILMDAKMPQMDGYETCRRLKSKLDLRHIPVIFMTGLTDEDSISSAFGAGAVDYVTKPVNTQELNLRVSAHLTNSKLMQSARMALDVSGRYYFATDAYGNFLWATPESLAFLADQGIENEWLMSRLPEFLQSFLYQPDNVTDQKKRLVDTKETVFIQPLSSKKQGEFLFQLVIEKTEGNTGKLKSLFNLTDREAEVLVWVARGKTNREVAIILDISPRTINKHLEQIFKKLGVENRTGAAGMVLKLID